MTDWIQLWNDLVSLREWRYQPNETPENHDRWKARAHDFDAHVRRRWAQPDSSRTFLVALLRAMPHATVLDIGAGTGKWAVILAPHAKAVTAIEPSPTMIERCVRIWRASKSPTLKSYQHVGKM
jgi:predicted O-methyltransferase YrrM